MEERYSTPRLAEAVSGLAAGAGAPELRAQLAALAGIVANLDAEPPDPDAVAALGERIDAGIAAEDEPAVVAAMAELAALERAPLRGFDWLAASGG